MANTVKITLKKSLIGAKKDQKLTAQALGLRKINQTVEKVDNVATNGMIKKVAHLVEVNR